MFKLFSQALVNRSKLARSLFEGENYYMKIEVCDSKLQTERRIV